MSAAATLERGGEAGLGLPIPNGWFVVAESKDVTKGAAVPIRRFGRDLVLFRTADGTPKLLDAYCPHLGAHMGHGGWVEGDALVCPFHAFKFEGDGRCVGTGYGSKPPRNSDVDAFHVVERTGLIFAWHHAEGIAPTWGLPPIDHTGWSDRSIRRVRLKTHPQETSENSVDFGHLGIVHGYDDLEITDPVKVEGEHLSIRYRMLRSNPFTLGRTKLGIDFEVNVHGLGFSMVQTEIADLGMRTRVWIFSSPVEQREVEVFIGSQGSGTSLGRMGRIVPTRVQRFLGSLANPVLLAALHHDVLQDKAIWENKRYEARPRIARGDGPIGRYRTYVRQFYAA